ncbi:nSTAND1 domain-containing NTPase [Nostoc sp. 'Peltigera membranacea cyanobiont' N6]|uniref:nSTAND1 domain-containing NTPase n=1 Tax=Nostoc sp. 'Peltigera membranacea cyanobiont' N6 TaxID=1261031 RepID=UPI0015E44965|nr:PD40 domain-containing protein [Nostoc sp. 'Peltigera membranacea cyanobiont' N6]
MNQDGMVTATELYSYLRDQVEIASENYYQRQTPSLCPLRKHDKGEFIFLLPDFDRDKLEDAPPLNVENNPYRGLSSYDEKDSNLFFGREEQIQKLYQKLVDNKQQLTLVLGASGTGKSSLVKAGLIPKLRKDDKTWRILPPFRPGESPLKSLNNVLESVKQPLIQAGISSRLFTPAEESLGNWFKNNPQAKLLVIIDQFEELITLSKSEEAEKFQIFIKKILAESFQSQSLPIYALAFSSDGKSIVGGGANNTLKLWNINGKKITELKDKHSDGCISSVAFNPENSNTIISGHWFNTVQLKGDTLLLWNVKNKKITYLNAHRFATYSVAFSPDGRTIASGGDDSTIQLRNIEGIPIEQPLVGHQERRNSNCWGRKSHRDYPSVSSVAFSLNGQMIISGGSDGTVRIWDSQSIAMRDFNTNSHKADFVAFSPDKRIVVTRNGKTLQLWDGNGNLIGKPLDIGTEASRTLSFSPDSKTIAVVSEKVVHLWGLHGNLINKIPIENVSNLVFSPDNKTIALVKGNTVNIWDLNKHFTIGKIKTDQSIYSATLRFSSDGKNIAALGSGSSDKQLLQTWDLTGNSIAKFEQNIYYSDNSVWFASTANILLTNKDRIFQLRDFKGNSIGKPLKYEGRIPPNNTLYVFLDEKAKMILISSNLDKDIWLWDLEGNPVRKLFKNEGELKGVTFSPDGKTIAIAESIGSPTESDKSSSIIIKDLNDNLISKLQLPDQLIQELSFSANGKNIISVTEESVQKSVQFWPGNWQTWLEIACNRLRNHPRLKATETQDAKTIQETCQSYVGNAQHERNEKITMDDKILPTTTANPSK